MAKRLLFLSTINLSLNPRVLKEVKLALSLGYEVTFVGFYLGDWSERNEEELKKELSGVRFIYLDATRRNYGRWLADSLIEKACRLAWMFSLRSALVAACAHSKRTNALLRLGKKTGTGRYDLIVAHTLATLYPAARMAKNNNCRFSFDMEDYHPGEHIDKDPEQEIMRRELLLATLLPEAFYVSAASALIAERTAGLPKNAVLKVHPVLNYFSRNEFVPPVPPVAKGEKIRLVWFSQNISEGRGLELILPVWEQLKDRCSLTLIGKPSPSFLEAYGKEMEDIEILEPMLQSELHKCLSKYDVGLALDLTSRDVNRDLALTNKILAYFQAGLYILATDTSAQKDFLDQYAGYGRLTRQDSASLLEGMNAIGRDILSIRSAAGKRFTDARAHCWETEGEYLEDLWKKAV
jgi:hypothetical protein